MHDDSPGCRCDMCRLLGPLEPLKMTTLCGIPDGECAAALAAAEARAEKAEGEVRYLRAHRAWQLAADRHTGWGSAGVITKKWLAANPEPQPPEGVAP